MRYLTSLGPDVLVSQLSRERLLRDGYDAITYPKKRPDFLVTANVQPTGFLESDRRRAEILTLSNERRWVADLGATSKRSSPVLSPVEAFDVVRLLDARQPVYVVSGVIAQDSKRRVGLSISNLNSTKLYGRDLELTVRQFEYRLTAVASADDLDAIAPSGVGLPPGILGVYADGHTITEVVAEWQYEYSMDVEAFRNSPLTTTRLSSSSLRWHTWHRDDRELSPHREPPFPIATPQAPGVLGLMGAIVSALACVLLGLAETESLIIIASIAVTGVVAGDALFVLARTRRG